MALVPPRSNRYSSPLRMMDSDSEVEISPGNMSMDYKKLAIEVANQISPDIQET